MSFTQLVWSSQPQSLNELYWLIARTRAPAATSCSVRCEPMKPSAPVTRTCEFRRSPMCRLLARALVRRSAPAGDKLFQPDHLNAFPDEAGYLIGFRLNAVFITVAASFILKRAVGNSTPPLAYHG